MVDRGGGPYRVLYVCGRPNWEFKFLRRALSEDEQVELVGLVRIARREPKFSFRSKAGEAADPRNDDGLYDVRAGARDARNLFAFSILYLSLLFATLLGEHLMGVAPLELFR